MPTKKTPAKKTTKVTANFTADIPEEVIDSCSSKGCGNNKKRHKKHSTGSLYFLGFVGAAIYYVTTATTFRIGALGILKAFVRPTFLVYGLLKFLGI